MCQISMGIGPHEAYIIQKLRLLWWQSKAVHSRHEQSARTDGRLGEALPSSSDESPIYSCVRGKSLPKRGLPSSRVEEFIINTLHLTTFQPRAINYLQNVGILWDESSHLSPICLLFCHFNICWWACEAKVTSKPFSSFLCIITCVFRPKTSSTVGWVRNCDSVYLTFVTNYILTIFENITLLIYIPE